jgi:hypothetical protein
MAIPQSPQHHPLNQKGQFNGFDCPQNPERQLHAPGRYDRLCFRRSQVANSTTAGSVVPMTFSLAPRAPAARRRFAACVSRRREPASPTRRCAFTCSTSFRPSRNGDNGAITIATGAAGYLGQVDVVINQAFTDGAAGQAHHRDQLQQPDALRAARSSRRVDPGQCRSHHGHARICED